MMILEHFPGGSCHHGGSKVWVAVFESFSFGPTPFQTEQNGNVPLECSVGQQKEKYFLKSPASST